MRILCDCIAYGLMYTSIVQSYVATASYVGSRDVATKMIWKHANVDVRSNLLPTASSRRGVSPGGKRYSCGRRHRGENLNTRQGQLQAVNLGCPACPGECIHGWSSCCAQTHFIQLRFTIFKLHRMYRSVI